MEPITVYDGWRLIRLEKRMDIPEAARLLCGRGRRRWANAVIEGEEAVLTGHAIRCPACGRDTPAYGDQGGSGVNKPRVLRWAARQASLFAQPERELVLSEVALPEGYFTCPHCRGCFPKNHRREQVRLERKGQKLMLSLVTADLRELLSLVDGGSALGIRLPLTEQLTFHFGRGRVVFSVTAADGACLLTRDVTDERYGWTESRICQLLATHRVLRRRVRRVFEEIWGGKLPFSEQDRTVSRWILMTRFQGYPRSFYDAVPYVGDGMTLDRDFRAVARRLRRAAELDSLYRASGLPHMKSIRRHFFEDPGLFFYLPETRLLWELVEDPNLFRKQLNAPCNYELLLFLRESPRTMQFFRDYKAVMGKEALLRKIRLSLWGIRHAANRYCMLTPRRQAEEREYWKNDGLRGNSVPLYTERERMPDQMIDGYWFTWLRSTYECKVVGKALENCLVEWEPGDSGVLAVMRGKEYEAAIQVCRGTVIQARGYQNCGLEGDEALNRAVRKWQRRYTRAFA